jgi:D-beta-D-heptose 7-phosphate kinase/D-beta-D-heptose 1-phosphate adenosyltransferase
LIGTDRGGQKLHDLLVEQNIDTGNVIRDADFPTIVKTRIIARNQQVVRVDREQLIASKPDVAARISEEVRQLLPEIDAIIFEDYGKGFLSPELVSQICGDAHAAGKIVSADPSPRHPINWQHVTVVKPNRTEAFLAAGANWEDPVDSAAKDNALLRVGTALLEKWDTQYLLITLGEQGMMLFQKGATPHHIPTKARQVFDVSGAGDTAVALFTLALCGDASPIEASEIATHASAVVVGKLGTATVTPEELHASFLDDGSVE